jgi:hypothetical protein
MLLKKFIVISFICILQAEGGKGRKSARRTPKASVPPIEVDSPHAVTSGNEFSSALNFSSRNSSSPHIESIGVVDSSPLEIGSSNSDAVIPAPTSGNLNNFYRRVSLNIDRIEFSGRNRVERFRISSPSCSSDLHSEGPSYEHSASRVDQDAAACGMFYSHHVCSF